MSAIKTIKPLNPRSPDTKYTGDEPQWRTQPEANRISALSHAFGWYNYFYGKKDAKEMIAAYLDRHERTKDAKKIRTMPDSQIRLTTGWLCRMSDMGLELTEQEQIKLDSMILELLEIKEEKKEEVVVVAEDTSAAKITIQDRLREKVSECAGEIEGLFDDFITDGVKMSANIKPIATIRGMNVAPQMISTISDIWKKRLEEFEEVAKGKDPQLVEAYSCYSKIDVRNMIKFCETVINDCGAYIQIKKVERKPRKAKPVSPEKQAGKFKFLKEFAELKLTGLPATALINKSEAWLYDTKKRKLIHVVADEYTKEFTVKNNAVIGFSTVETVQKTLRKPAEQLKSITSSGKPAARKYFKDIKATEVAWNARGTENIIILKSW
jgi:hypothetical protein